MSQSTPTLTPPEDKSLQIASDSDDHPEVTTKKRAGRESPLTDGQKEVVDSFIPAWEALLTRLKLHLGKEGKSRDEAEVTDWTSKSLKAILKTPEFSSSAVSRTPSDWQKVSGQYFMPPKTLIEQRLDTQAIFQESSPQRLHQEKYQGTCEECPGHRE